MDAAAADSMESVSGRVESCGICLAERAAPRGSCHRLKWEWCRPWWVPPLVVLADLYASWRAITVLLEAENGEEEGGKGT